MKLYNYWRRYGLFDWSKQQRKHSLFTTVSHGLAITYFRRFVNWVHVGRRYQKMQRHIDCQQSDNIHLRKILEENPTISAEEIDATVCSIKVLFQVSHFPNLPQNSQLDSANT